MTHPDESSASASPFSTMVKDTIASYPCAGQGVVTTRSPGVVDVMGGVVEDSGALVLTSTVDVTFTASMWRVADDRIHLRLVTDAAQGSFEECDLPVAAFPPKAAGTREIMAACREAGSPWALPACLTLRQALADGLIPGLGGGLMVLLQSGFPCDADLGRHWVLAATTVDGLCRLFDSPADRLRKGRLCADAMLPLTNLYNLRAPMTALCGPPDGSLLQMRFHPQMMCQTLKLPPGVMVAAARTRLARPTTHQRLIDTRMCAEMGRCMIVELQRLDGKRADPAATRLASITPPEYVEHYRDRLPSKIKGLDFAARFGSLRGLNGELDPQSTYKVRSRAEHHIYENRRVHDFATSLALARRSPSTDALIRAGDLMYASHWSHSQRCGIGGMEADQLVSAIRVHGPKAGLFGAKVTGGGEGGEVVVLMRDDERAHAALMEAVATAEAASDRTIQTYMGSVEGAEFFQPPELDGVLGSPSTV